MENKLLPCPFCGSEPEKVYKSNGQTTHIECPNCRAQFPKSTMTNRYDDAWNTRAGRICTCGWHGFIDGWGHDAPNYCPNCGGRVMRDE